MPGAPRNGGKLAQAQTRGAHGSHDARITGDTDGPGNALSRQAIL